MVKTFTIDQSTSGFLRRLKIGVLISCLLLLSAGVMAQESTISGKVQDAESGEPLPGVTILVVGTGNGTITDLDGNYSLTASSDKSLLFSFIGFQSQEVKIGSLRIINIKMDTDLTSLDEVVVIGYGTQLKKVVTAATVQVSGEDLQKRSITNPLQALQGQAAGVLIRSTSGQPGEGLKVNIRGVGTIGNSGPLYIVDGMQTGDISYLNNADILTIDVLKDAASAAIYGSRAANGVVLITTKKGRAGKASISFDSYYGVQNLAKKVDMLNSTQYAQIINEQFLNSGGSVSSLPFNVTNLPAYTAAGSANTNWQDEMFVKNAATKNYSLGATGGTDQTSYSMSFSYTGQEGILGGAKLSNYDRYGARVNTEHKYFNGKLKIGENLTYASISKNGVAVGNQYSNTLRGAFNSSPLLPVYDDQGEFFNTADNSNIDQNGKTYWNNTESSPYASMAINNQNEYHQQKLFGNAYAELELVKNLKIRSSVGLDQSSDDYRSYTPKYQLSVYSLSNFSKAYQSMSRGRTLQFDNTANYTLNAGASSLDFMVGTSARHYTTSWISGSNSNLSFNDFDHAWLSNATNQEWALLSIGGAPISVNDETNGEDKLLSFFGRVQYDFRKKYMFNATVRADGSSKFAKGNQWGYFPSVSAGWIVSDEGFLKSVTLIDFLKVRASWGRNGNQNIPSFQFLAPISFNQATYNFGNQEAVNTPGAYPSRLAYEKLKWETSQQFDLGADLRLLRNSITLSLDWYRKTTIDWLINAPVLATAGALPPTINGGNVQNTGIEMVLKYENKIGDLNYSISANGAYNKNVVKEVPTEDGIVHGATNSLYANSSEFYRAQSGHPVGYFWGYQTNGLFQNNEDVSSYTNDAGKVIQPNAKPGDVRYIDQNGDGIINTDDKVEIGNPNPPFTFGLTLAANYKGFDVSIMTYGVAGNQIVQSYREHSNKYSNYTTDILNRWTGEGTSNRIPRVTNGNVNYQFSDLFIQDGAFLRIGNVSLGYDLKQVLKLQQISQLRLYVAANNLYTFTKYNGMDADIGYGFDNGIQDKFSSGIDLGYYPNPRTVMIGANIKF